MHRKVSGLSTCPKLLSGVLRIAIRREVPCWHHSPVKLPKLGQGKLPTGTWHMPLATPAHYRNLA